MADQEYDNTDRGAVYNAEGYKVLKQGTLNFGSTETYVAIVHKKLSDGREYLEVWQQIGGVKIKPDSERKDPVKSPNIVGGVTYNGSEYHLSGWKKTSKKGQPFTSLALTLKNQDSDGDGGSESGSEPSSTDYDDEIPF